MTLNLKDPALAEQLLKEIADKRLPTKSEFFEGVEARYYAWHQRPKIFFKKLVIGHITGVKLPSTVECELEHPRGVNMMMGPHKNLIRVGRR